MAAEHIYKMLLAENKKRKRTDDAGEQELPAPKAQTKRKAKTKSGEK